MAACHLRCKPATGSNRGAAIGVNIDGTLSSTGWFNDISTNPSTIGSARITDDNVWRSYISVRHRNGSNAASGGDSANYGFMLVDELRQRGIHFKSLTDSIDTSSPMGRFIFHFMSALAEMERELIVERTRAGLAAAREKGRIGGRRPKLTPEQWAQAGRLIANGMDRKQVAIIYDVAVCTLYKKFPAR